MSTEIDLLVDIPSHVTRFVVKRLPAIPIHFSAEVVISDETQRFFVSFLYFACVKLFKIFPQSISNKHFTQILLTILITLFGVN